MLSAPSSRFQAPCPLLNASTSIFHTPPAALVTLTFAARSTPTSVCQLTPEVITVSIFSPVTCHSRNVSSYPEKFTPAAKPLKPPPVIIVSGPLSDASMKAHLFDDDGSVPCRTVNSQVISEHSGQRPAMLNSATSTPATLLS